MTASNNGNDDRFVEVRETPAVGSARAHELRKIGITDVRELSSADADELTTIYGIGSTLARKMIGQAQGLFREYAAQFDGNVALPWADDGDDGVRPDIQNGENVVIVAGEDAFKGMSNEDAQEAIWEAVIGCPRFELNEVGTFGWMSTGNASFSMMGEVEISDWIARVVVRRDHGMNEIPAQWNDHANGSDALKARNQVVARWADVVVVVRGEDNIQYIETACDGRWDVEFYDHDPMQQKLDAGVDPDMIEQRDDDDIADPEAGVWHTGQMDDLADRNEGDSKPYGAGGGAGTSGPREFSSGQ